MAKPIAAKSVTVFTGDTCPSGLADYITEQCPFFAGEAETLAGFYGDWASNIFPRKFKVTVTVERLVMTDKETAEAKKAQKEAKKN